MPGRFYLTATHLCFYGTVVVSADKAVIPLQSILRMEKAPMRSIKIVTCKNEVFNAGQILKRGKFFNRIVRNWRLCACVIAFTSTSWRRIERSPNEDPTRVDMVEVQKVGASGTSSEDATVLRQEAMMALVNVFNNAMGQRSLKAIDLSSFVVLRGKQAKQMSLRANENEFGDDVLLKDIFHGILHARAAYGLATYESHMETAHSWLVLNTLNRAVINAHQVGFLVLINLSILFSFRSGKCDCDPSDDWTEQREHHRMRLQRQVIQRFSPLGSHFSHRKFCPCYYIAVDHDRRWVILCVRGTLAER